MAARDVRDSKLYQKAFTLAMGIFTISKAFPKEEIYSLTSEIRRSSRSVCSCLREAYQKKRYPAHFIAKITDADMENSETGTWLDFSFNCEYVNSETYKKLREENEEIGKMLNHILNNPEKY